MKFAKLLQDLEHKKISLKNIQSPLLYASDYFDWDTLLMGLVPTSALTEPVPKVHHLDESGSGEAGLTSLISIVLQLWKALLLCRLCGFMMRWELYSHTVLNIANPIFLACRTIFVPIRILELEKFQHIMIRRCITKSKTPQRICNVNYEMATEGWSWLPTPPGLL